MKEKNLARLIVPVSVVVGYRQTGQVFWWQFQCLITVQSHPQSRARIPSRAGAVPRS